MRSDVLASGNMKVITRPKKSVMILSLKILHIAAPEIFSYSTVFNAFVTHSRGRAPISPENVSS